ncbi:MAG: hypothetical protein KF817_04875 [Phycisphaeraceae bacterium]|nr:hypothetical protein [Phycisphaeraceae bacterium]
MPDEDARGHDPEHPERTEDPGYRLEPALTEAPDRQRGDRTGQGRWFSAARRHRPSTDDVLCVFCANDLAGLPEEGACPECGRPIERSIRGDRLSCAPRAYLRRLSAGTSLVFGGLVVAIAVPWVVMALHGLLAGNGALTMVAAPIIIAARLGGLLVLFGGWSLLGTLHPDYVHDRAAITVSVMVRVAAGAAVIAATLTVGAGLIGWVHDSQAAPAPWMREIGRLVDGPTAFLPVSEMVVQATLFVASMLHVRWLAARIPNERLRAGAGLGIWVLPLATLLLSPLLCIGPLLAPAGYLVIIAQLRSDLRGLLEQPEAAAP